VANRSSETWNLMASSPFLQKLTTYQKTWLESILAPRELNGPGLLVKEGASEQFFIIRSGEAVVKRGERLLARLRDGDFIGSLSRISRQEISPYTITYPGSLSLFGVSREDVRDFIEGNPGTAMKLALPYELKV
jgi:CRP-like cAMP-binding protein